jgi:hypothetical protein
VDISCALAPVPETADHIALAERLGYLRAWVYDTPALQLDVWYLLRPPLAKHRVVRVNAATEVIQAFARALGGRGTAPKTGDPIRAFVASYRDVRWFRSGRRRAFSGADAPQLA